jgi:hypothetical protein
MGIKMKNTSFILSAMIGCFGLVSMTGCGPSMPNVAKASGVVTLDGKPVPEAKVMFHPTAGGPRTSYGTTNDKGEFQASTFGTYDGSLIGECAITITKTDTSAQPKITGSDGYMGKGYDQMMAPANLAKINKPKFVIPQKYSAKETSGLQVTVVQGEVNRFTFDLTSDGK